MAVSPLFTSIEMRKDPRHTKHFLECFFGGISGPHKPPEGPTRLQDTTGLSEVLNLNVRIMSKVCWDFVVVQIFLFV